MISVRREQQFLAVFGEHWEAIEAAGVRDSLEMGAVSSDHIKVKFSAFWVFPVRTKNDSLSVRMKERGKGSLLQLRDLSVVRSVRVHQPDFEF